jgi:hypothetical protein
MDIPRLAFCNDQDIADLASIKIQNLKRENSVATDIRQIEHNNMLISGHQLKINELTDTDYEDDSESTPTLASNALRLFRAMTSSNR